MHFYPADPMSARRGRRVKPMRVLTLGLPRTGNSSICAALQELGIRSYHFSEMAKHKENKHFDRWFSTVEAKYDINIPKTWSTCQIPEDFDNVLGSYDAVSDNPCCLFAEELIAAYPNAKLILTKRASSDVWYRSMESSVIEILSWRKSFALLSFFDHEFTAPYMALLNRTTRVFSGGIQPTDPAARPAMEEFYHQHARHVEQLAAARGKELLIYEPGMGWEPLCEFLGVPVPTSPYPQSMSTTEALRLEWKMYWERWYSVLRGGFGLRMNDLVFVFGILAWGYWLVTSDVLTS